MSFKSKYGDLMLIKFKGTKKYVKIIKKKPTYGVV